MLIIIIGFLSGILSGMGVGGGMVLIPALTMLKGVEQHVAQTVNLFYFIPTAVTALIVHIKNKNIEYRPALKLVASGILFSLLGAWLAVRLPSDVLRRIFGGFIIIAGIREIFAGKKLTKTASNK